MVSNIFYETHLVKPGLKRASLPKQELFIDLEDKVSKLMSRCSSSCIIGLSANELLAARGDKSLMWIDIDSNDHEAVSMWLNKSCLLPKDSYAMVLSSTMRWHMYVVTHRPIQNNECISMYEHLASTIDDPRLRICLDRVYGPNVTSNVIYIPGASRGRPSLPQELCRDLKGVYNLPDNLENVEWHMWPQRRKALRLSCV